MHRHFPYTTSKIRCRALLGKRTDTKLIARLCSGQPAAWAQLVDRWSPRLYSYIYYNTSDEVIARRLLQTILSEVIHVIITQPKIQNLSVLIFTIAHRQIVAHCRTFSIAVPQKNMRPETTTQSLGSADFVDGYFFNRFRQFPLEIRQILLLRYVCGVTLLELAQIVGKPEEALLQVIERANIYFQ